MEDNLTVKEQVKSCVEKEIGNIIECDLTQDSIKYLGELIDIHKDIENENYWKEKIEMMYGRNYTDNSYGRRRRDSRGRYYGNNTFDEMIDRYNRYSTNHEQSRRGVYGAKEDSLKSLEYMLASVEDFFEMLEDDATSQEEVEMIKRTARKIAEM